MKIKNELLQNGKRRIQDVSDIEETDKSNDYDTNSDLNKNIYNDNYKNNKDTRNMKSKRRKRAYKRHILEIVDSSKLSYRPLCVTEEDDNKLIQNIINDPIRGYFFYENLGDQLGTALRYFTRQSGMYLTPKRIVHLKFQDWDQFIDEFRAVAEDREIWRKVANQLDIYQIALNCVQYRRVIVDFLNNVYVGYTEGLDKMNWKFSENLSIFASKCSNQYTKDLNIQYYKLLSKEFNEFFNFTTGFGNTKNIFIKRESLYISHDNLNVKDTGKALKWTPEEKDIFYESLARYGISRIDEIATLIPNKSVVDVMNLYNALSNELKRYKLDKNLRKKLLSYDDLPIAYEVSENFIKTEENFASAIEKLDENQFSTLHGEYRGKYYSLMNSKCEDLFNMENMERLLKLSNDIENKDVKTKAIIEIALFDIYNLIQDFTTELIQRLFVKKLNKLSLPQQLEWTNLLKAFKKPNNPQTLVRILNLANMNKNVVENIDYFNSFSDDDSETDDDDNNYYPEFSTREIRMLERTDPNGIEIADRLDIWRLGITKKDVQEVSRQLLNETKTSNKLYMQLKGRLSITKDKPKKRTKPIDNETLREEIDLESHLKLNSDADSETDYTDDDSGDTNDNDNSNANSDDDQDAFNEFAMMLENNQNIDDLQSDNEFQELIDIERTEVGQISDVEHDNIKWYDEEFIIPDFQYSEHDTTQIYTDLDLTVRGHENLQLFCDEEEKKLNVKDYMDSLVHENLLLTQLTSTPEEDELNSYEYAYVFANINYGGQHANRHSWKTQFGGPPLIFSNEQIKKNVNTLCKHIETKHLPQTYKVNDNEHGAEFEPENFDVIDKDNQIV
jgi:hypothetical protein